MREQAMREAALARNAPQVANPAPQQNPIPTQVAPPQEVQVPHQVQDVASQAVEAFRAPAQSAASAGRGLLSSLWSGIGGLQEGFVRSTTPPGRDGHQPQPLGPLYGSTVPPTPLGRDGLCHQASPLRYPGHRFTRLLRHQAQAHRRAALQEVQPRQPCQEVQQHLTWVTRY